MSILKDGRRCWKDVFEGEYMANTKEKNANLDFQHPEIDCLMEIMSLRETKSNPLHMVWFRYTNFDIKEVQPYKYDWREGKE